ncbi:hypothetical protein DFH11DRAFT_1876749 [Phellopilus nigrolimitatus]|nr:hypothetical protein DFH11DRAFT_1876749 [Phellopilus nigrolimitatus]
MSSFHPTIGRLPSLVPSASPSTPPSTSTALPSAPSPFSPTPPASSPLSPPHATKEKTHKLDELKAKMKVKSEKKRVREEAGINERSSSPVDMEMSSKDEEDGQISKLEQQETRESRLLNKAKLEDKDLTLEDLEKCQLSRNKLVKYAVRGFRQSSWVRYLNGANQGQPVYRICEFANLGANPAKPYKIENEYFDTSLELRHGAAIKVFPMDKVSNVAFTEADVTAILVRKAELNHSRPKTRTTAAKAALERMRALAQMRRDFAESAALDAWQGADILAKVNERNRQANRNSVRRAEVAEAERRKKTRLARAVLANGSRPGTPGVLKCVLLLFFCCARPTDFAPSCISAGTRQTDVDARRVACARGRRALRVAPLLQKGVLGKRAFESIVASSVEVDLVDF